MGGGSFYKFINKDVKELNGIIVSLFSVLFLVGVGLISYKISNSYALFGDSITGSNTIGVEVVIPDNGAMLLILKEGTGGLEKIVHEADSTLQIGATSDIIEYRYRGKNPNNYIIFNDELWRIIGVFPTDDGTGNIENRIKIIRDEPIGEMYWTTSFNTETNSYNNWTGGTLDIYLNNDYYNSLTNDAKNMIDDVKYYLGGYISSHVTKEDMYIYERKMTNDDSCIYDSDTALYSGNCYFYKNNPISLVSKISIMYMSDYGYAVDDNCVETFNNYNNTLCVNNNWLYDGNLAWFLTIRTSHTNRAFTITLDGGVANNNIYMNEYPVRPVLYLAPDIMITSGSGTSIDPYDLKL